MKKNLVVTIMFVLMAIGFLLSVAQAAQVYVYNNTDKDLKVIYETIHTWACPSFSAGKLNRENFTAKANGQTKHDLPKHYFCYVYRLMSIERVEGASFTSGGATYWVGLHQCPEKKYFLRVTIDEVNGKISGTYKCR
jgi:hypothetical protein